MGDRADRKVKLADLKLTTTLAGAKPVEFAEATHGVVRESQVDILLMIPPQIDEEGVFHTTEDRLKNRLIRVKVWSKRKQGLFSFTDIPCAGKNQQQMAHAVEYAAPALGERQEVLYADKHELSRLSRDARAHFMKLCEHLAKEGDD